jgi:hypothetical protein
LNGITNVDFKELKSQLDQFKDNAIKTASVIENNTLAYLQDNMGADVANVRSTLISPLTNSDRGNDDADSAEIDVDPVTETTLCHEEYHIKEDGDSPQDRIMKDFVDIMTNGDNADDDVTDHDVNADSGMNDTMPQSSASSNQKEKRQQYCTSQRETVPLNEFTEGSRLHCMAYPEHYEKPSGTLTKSQSRHQQATERQAS